MYEDAVPMPLDPITNPYGVGFVGETTVVSESGALDTDPSRHRTFKIRNDKVINKITQKPVAYKILMPASQMLLANPSSPYHRAAIFGTKPVWITSHRDGENYPVGDYTYQDYRDDDIKVWADRRDAVVNTDLLFWHSKSNWSSRLNSADMGCTSFHVDASSSARGLSADAYREMSG